MQRISFKKVKEMLMENWIEEELATVDIGDVRLNKRMGLLLERFSGQPQASIPAASRGLAETTAAYRFFDNAKVTEEAVLAPHREATLARMRAHPVVLLLHDTTQLDYTGKEATEGLGELEYENRIGLLKHTTLAVTPERLALGVVRTAIWGRREDRERDRAKIKKWPIEEKESFRWIEDWQAACAMAEQAPQTQVVSVRDRESDIYELYVEQAQPAGPRADWIVRLCQNRRVEGPGETIETVRAQMKRWKKLGEIGLRVEAAKKRPGREATLTVRSGSVRLKPPFRPGKRLPEVCVHIVWVRERRPPRGCDPVEWILVTSLPVATFDQALTVVDYYCCRWQIEIFFKILKSGCRVEQLQLENDARLRPCIALYQIVAWRVLYVMMLGRQCPQLPCTVAFEEAEWKSVWTITQRTALPDRPPTLQAMVGMVASLGGYLGRKADGPPGPKPLWIGLQRTKDFAEAWLVFGPPPET